MTENVLCIHDSGDNDGRFSAAIIKAVYPKAILQGWRFGDPVSIADLEEKHGKFDTIIVADLPLLQPVKEWQNIEEHLDREKTKGIVTHIQGYKVLWFDHHVSNKATMEELHMFPVAGNFKIENCGARNAYDYFVEHDMIERGIQSIKYIDTYDTWKKEGGQVIWSKALAFNFGINVLEDKDDIDYLVENFIHTSDNILTTLEKGYAIKQYLEQESHWLQDKYDECEMDGIKIKFFNVTSAKSYMAELLNDDEGVVALWSHDGEYYYYSLRTKRADIDLSVLAKKYGGGGHAQASGFKADTLLHKLLPVFEKFSDR